MGDDNTKKVIEPWSFLTDAEATLLFAEVDYSLKNGKHIQRWKGQMDIFRFIERNEDSLRIFYHDYFGIQLEYSGQTVDKYYYLNFNPDSRGGIPHDNRHFIANEHIIIGFLLYKIIYIDKYIELNSVAAFQKMVRQDYEELKPGLYRILAKARREKTTELDDNKVDDIIAAALKTFDKIGWIELEGQMFDPLPSFQRLPKIYGDYINDIDNWFKKEGVNETVPKNT